MKICILCDEEIIGYGNNANPVADGECCNNCNGGIIIPVRRGFISIEAAQKFPELYKKYKTHAYINAKTEMNQYSHTYGKTYIFGK